MLRKLYFCRSRKLTSGTAYSNTFPAWLYCRRLARYRTHSFGIHFWGAVGEWKKPTPYALYPWGSRLTAWHVRWIYPGRTTGMREDEKRSHQPRSDCWIRYNLAGESLWYYPPQFESSGDRWVSSSSNGVLAPNVDPGFFRRALAIYLEWWLLSAVVLSSCSSDMVASRKVPTGRSDITKFVSSSRFQKIVNSVPWTWCSQMNIYHLLELASKRV